MISCFRLAEQNNLFAPKLEVVGYEEKQGVSCLRDPGVQPERRVVGGHPTCPIQSSSRIVEEHGHQRPTKQGCGGLLDFHILPPRRRLSCPPRPHRHAALRLSRGQLPKEGRVSTRPAPQVPQRGVVCRLSQVGAAGIPTKRCLEEVEEGL